jgi:hypothetical protein
VLTQTYARLNARVQALRFRTNQDSAKWQRAVQEHEAQMVDALAARDGAGAARGAGAAPAAQARHRAAADAKRRRLPRIGRPASPMKHDDPAPAAPGTVLPPNEACANSWQRRLRAETRGEVLFDDASRGRYATDASIYQIMPVGVFVPETPEDVATALAIARELKVPVLPRGGGTSQCGQTVGAALVIDCSKHLRRVLDVDVERRTATVEPGLVLDHLNAQLKPHGLWYPVDVSTSAQATLGGMAGNNSCGSRSIAYGNMVHNVAGAEAWLADGTGRFRAGSTMAAARAARIAGLRATWPNAPRPRSTPAGRRCCAAWAATTSTSSTPAARSPTPPTAASTWRTCWWAPKARWPSRRA